VLEIRKTDTYAQWLDGLHDIKARARDWHVLNASQPAIREM
jgi:putative component of toxin-antitoxin plasmid stabilization module